VTTILVLYICSQGLNTQQQWVLITPEPRNSLLKQLMDYTLDHTVTGASKIHVYRERTKVKIRRLWGFCIAQQISLTFRSVSEDGNNKYIYNRCEV
jgi:hypothetical protein